VTQSVPTASAESAPLARIFRFLIAKRWWVITVYALLLIPASWLAAQVQQDNSIDRLIVASDPDYIAMREFEHVFGAGEYALLLAQADDPFTPGVLDQVDRIERAVAAVPGTSVNSALSIFRRAKAGFTPTPDQAEGFREFVSQTDLFRRQGLVGDGFLAIGLVLDAKGTEQRAELLAAIDRAVASASASPSPLKGLCRLGQPYVNVYLDQTQRTAWRYFLILTVFVIALNLFLYHSLRTLVAFLLTLGVCLATSVGYIGATGGMFTIVSPMVPMTILVTATATLVYLHSRFVQRPAGCPVDTHQIFALCNKFVACTASIFATATGFGALVLSPIRPIREMGSWVAVGLFLSWLIVFTLFPALQKVLATPTWTERPPTEDWFLRLAHRIPRWSYRFRWPLVLGALGSSVAGAVALFGLPGWVAPMRIVTDPVEMMDHGTELYRDIRQLTPLLPGLSITQVWLRGGLGSISEPNVLSGLHRFQELLETDPDVGAAIGPTTILRMIRYIGGEGDGWPRDAAEREALAGELEALASREPLLRRFVEPHTLAQAQVTVVSRVTEHQGFERLASSIRRDWEEAAAEYPELAELQVATVGLTPLNAKMAQSLVPTLVHSFVLTVVVIFSAFLLVFRSGPARVMAMIPSIFAILMMFGLMRTTGMMLNVATILIASTVLGTSENDQIHFFYHFLEKRRDGTIEEALTHSLLVAGRAIFFATLINAGGFLAFTISDLPPMRQFGVLSASAFVLSMLADFTALPAALWILFRAKPDPAGSLS
jgi:predicted RND superfamily exporter protein